MTQTLWHRTLICYFVSLYPTLLKLKTLMHTCFFGLSSSAFISLPTLCHKDLVPCDDTGTKETKTKSKSTAVRVKINGLFTAQSWGCFCSVLWFHSLTEENCLFVWRLFILAISVTCPSCCFSREQLASPLRALKESDQLIYQTWRTDREEEGKNSWEFYPCGKFEIIPALTAQAATFLSTDGQHCHWAVCGRAV